MYSYPLSYLSFLAHFHEDRDYFECHEVLEEFWKEKTDQAPDSVWVGLIQMAVSLYHHRRGNFIGAKKLMTKAVAIFHKREEELGELSIDREALLHQLSCRLREIENEESFTDMAIPFSDTKIVKQYRDFLQSSFLPAEEPAAEYIYHKHKMRDRSDVLAAREESLRTRRQLAAAAK
ncbi:DUF309 domain-containing protein [Bacillus thermotolerans]|uniref:DUF309 domain-containing protein n=1 Tax=Bacillus thermotolerans TaxID=1221996 RepID=A0A0F5HXY9_BACTR|nr:DUF309 domain-containing protein [Bacillus thermotolerans]KKB37920.1 hypothetical protein QY95_02697 [Bacillus thermotolerans]